MYSLLCTALQSSVDKCSWPLWMAVVIPSFFISALSTAHSTGSLPVPAGIILLPELPPFSVEYADTTDYHWPVVSGENTNNLVDGQGRIKAEKARIGAGPWGFEEATQIGSQECLVKSAYDKPRDDCIRHPQNCPKGLSFSIWEKVSYTEDVLNVHKNHAKHYILSTGGDYDQDKEKAYPGFALYHHGMDLVAVMSTGRDVWELRVKGQLENETWSNIGVTWNIQNNDPKLHYSQRGGLELYVNAQKVGHSVLPLARPGMDPVTNSSGEWTMGEVLIPDETWGGVAMSTPIMLIGCHRNSDDTAFRHYRGQSVAFDELSIWTRKLVVNRTHDETLFFTGGYMAQFEGVSAEEWLAMMDHIELDVPAQAEVAAVVSEKYASKNETRILDLGSDPNGTECAKAKSSTPFDSDFPRTSEEQDDYYRQKKASSVALKLLGTLGVRTSERAKYLTRRFSILPVVGAPLEGTDNNIRGWNSVQLDPNEEGASQMVNRMDNFILRFMGSADIDHDEDYPPVYRHDLADMTIHSAAPGYTMSASKVKPDMFQKYGSRLQLNEFYENHPVNPNPLWSTVDESVEIPTQIPFKNQSLCAGKPFTLMTAIYSGYGKLAPLRRNPATIYAKEFKLDAKPISVKIRVNPDPRTDNLTTSFEQECSVNEDEMKYSPVKIRFYHNDLKTSKRKLLWFEDGLKTNIELRRCVVFNEDLGMYGGWDANKCTTLITDQASTLCECGTFGTFAIVAEMVEDPSVGPEDNWLLILKYLGYVVSMICFLTFITVVILSTPLWEMFHLMRLNAAICMLMAHGFMFLAELQTIREDRLLNVIFSLLQQYWILASAGFLCSESFATFEAITSGIIGGKLLSYIPIVYGMPFINLGVTLFLYAEDYGKDPRAFIGWENPTKLMFFYFQWPLAFCATFLCLIILINLATPQTRKESVMETLGVQAQGLAVLVFIYATTWGFAYPAFIRFQDQEMADFYPIFAILNSWLGFFFMAFMGIGSRQFRNNLMGQYKKKSALMVGYMIPTAEDDADEEEFNTEVQDQSDSMESNPNEDAEGLQGQERDDPPGYEDRSGASEDDDFNRSGEHPIRDSEGSV